MQYKIRLFLDESILLEENISDLYRLFSVKYPADSEFWHTISLEEVNHAALIRTIDDLFLPERILPMDSIDDHTARLKFQNQFVQQQIVYFRESNPGREEAFSLGVKLETSIGEMHFQKFVSVIPDSVVERIFHKLNGEDRNHARRILSYMRDNGLELQSDSQSRK